MREKMRKNKEKCIKFVTRMFKDKVLLFLEFSLVFMWQNIPLNQAWCVKKKMQKRENNENEGKKSFCYLHLINY